MRRREQLERLRYRCEQADRSKPQRTIHVRCRPGHGRRTDWRRWGGRRSRPELRQGWYQLADCRGQPGTAGYRCESAKLQHGLDCGGYRLPTEAEWEYAARAETTTAIYAGDLTLVGERNGPELDSIAWYGGNSGVEYEGSLDCSDWVQTQFSAKRCGPHPVRGKAANSWNLYDMLGNVFEWTWGRSGSYSTVAVTDPIGSDGGAERVIRGGAWDDEARDVRAASRDGIHPEIRNHFLGFRLSRGQSEPGAEPR